MSSRLLIASSLSAIVFAAACSQQSGSADTPSTIDTSDRAAIEKIVREYLIENPEVLVEAFEALEDKQRAAEIARVKNNPELLARIEDDPRDFSIGPADAEVTVVEYFDYLCGFCKRSVDQVMQIAEEHPGTVRVVFKEFPILSAESELAAAAALAAKKQGKYLEMHMTLMGATREQMNEEGISAFAEQHGLDVDQLLADMKSEDVQRHIADVRQTATASGTDATPSFFVNGHKVAGANLAAVNTLIENAAS